MANNMIALQARAPQTDILGGSIARNAQAINMMRQQDVAERQAATAAQQMQIAAAQEARAAAKAGQESTKAALDNEALLYAKHRRLAPAVVEGGAPVYAEWLLRVAEDSPAEAAIIKQALPIEKFDKDVFTRMMASMDDLFAARYGKAITKELIGPGGEMYGANISGIPGASYATPLPDISKPLTGGRTAPRGVTPPAAMPAPSEIPGGRLRATQGVNTRPEDLLSQGQPANRIPSGSPFSPISDTGAAQPDLGGIVQQMMQTGVVSQSNLQALRAAAGPDKEQQLAQLMRSSNIKIMPDEQQFGGMQSAVYRPGEGDASAAQVQYNPNDYVQVRVKSPMQSPETSIPGSAKVPISRVREEAQAGRKTPKEIYDEKRMEKRAEADADFLENIPKARENAQFLTNLVGQMIGDATVNSKGQIVVKPGGRAPKAGFEDVVGATWRPGARFISGTNAADFDALLKQVEGQQFLKAYETLKGTGQITEIEGQKATDAMSRMKRSVSEVEFVRAAREFLGIVQKGLDRLNQREATLNAPAMPAGKRRTPVQKGGPKELRFNPATGDFE